MKITLGEMIRRLRTEKEIDESLLCNGLCSATMISYFEREKKVPDSLLFERLVERLGMLPEEFSIMVTERELEYFSWREKVYDALEEEKWEELEGLLEEDVTEKIICNEKLEKQFYCYVKAICLGRRQEYAKAAKLLEIAIDQSIPDIMMVGTKGILLGKMEFHILMLYLYYGVLGQELDKETGKHFLYQLEKLMIEGKQDDHEKAKVYPKLIGIGLLVLGEDWLEEEQWPFCEKAVHLLRERRYFCDIMGVLPQYIILLEKRGAKELSFYKKQYEIFCEIFEDAGISKEFHPEHFVIKRSKVYLIHEYLAFRRKETGYTQENISEGICAPETYSRIENAKRAPSRKNLEVLVERLDIHWCYYRGELDTSDPKALRLRRAHRDAQIVGDYQKSLKILEELERRLDMKNPMNYQYVESCKCMVEYKLGFILPDDAYERLETLLNVVNEVSVDKEGLVYYSQIELEILTFLARIREEQGRSKEGILLLERVVRQLQKSKVRFEYQWNGISYLLKELSDLYLDVGNYERALEVINYVYVITIKRRDGSQLSYELDSIGDIFEHMERQDSEKYKKLYRQSFYMADFFGILGVRKTMKAFYEENFEPEIIWYED